MEKFPEKSFIDKAKSIGAKAVVFGAMVAGMSSEAKATNLEDSTKNKKDKIALYNDARKIETNLNENSEKVEIKIANYFETDKATISKENEGAISKLIIEYVSNLNSNNVGQFINSTPQLNVSCDPRKTNSYENGNRGLAQARAEEAQKVIKEAVAHFDFSNLDLTPDQINKIIEKFSNLNFNIPPDGVVDYHTVATESDWEEAKTNETKKLEIFQKMRYVNLELNVLIVKEIKDKIEKEGGVFDVEDYKKVILLVDKSPSMEDSKKELIKNLLDGNKVDIPTFVVGYTNKIDTAFKAENLKDGAKIIKDMKFVNENKELTIDATIEALEIEEVSQEKGIVFIVTDEDLQNVSKNKLDKLEKLSVEKNITLQFTIMSKGHTYKFSLEDVKKEFEQKYKESGKDKKIKTQEERIQFLKNYLQNEEAGFSVVGGKKSDLKKLEQSTKETKEMIDIAENRLHALYEIDIDDFAGMEKQKIQFYPGPDYTKKPNTAVYPGSISTKDK